MLTTLSVYHFNGSGLWPFVGMARARPWLRNVDGLRFVRLLGCGRGAGFTLAPDFHRYALLAVWDDPQAWRNFERASTFAAAYRAHAERCSTLLLEPVAAHGTWDGLAPFAPLAAPIEEGEPIGILTRATIRSRRLRPFWSDVPSVSRALEAAPGLLASIGIGELPFIRQATFSLWRDLPSAVAFAYRGRHRDVVARTRREEWYREDLFARFRILETIGSFP